jgi:hypothetical protein
MNVCCHKRPLTGTSFYFTYGHQRSNSGDLLSDSGEELLRRRLLPAFCLLSDQSADNVL